MRISGMATTVFAVALTIEFEDGSVDSYTASDVDPDALESC